MRPCVFFCLVFPFLGCENVRHIVRPFLVNSSKFKNIMTVFQVAFQPFGIANCMRWRAYIPIGCTLFLRIVLLSQKTTYMYLLGSASFVFLSLFCLRFASWCLCC